MAKPKMKPLFLYITLSVFWLAGTAPAPAQDISMTGTPDPEVLVSPPPVNNEPPPPEGRQASYNMETSLVSIKAVDAPALISFQGKTGVGTAQRFGQGIIIDPNGIIATNRHIIVHPAHIYVTLSNDQTFEATVLSQSQADLCLLKIDVPFALRSMALADPGELQIGRNVTAIPNTSLNHQPKEDGEIIKVYKDISNGQVELMEMNIPLNPGDSGGAVVNQDGSLLGLIMGKQISDPSKSYAIAAGMIQQEYIRYKTTKQLDPLPLP